MLQAIFADLFGVFASGEVGELEIMWDDGGAYVVYTGRMSFTEHYSFENGVWENDTDEDSCAYGSDEWMWEVGIL